LLGRPFPAKRAWTGVEARIGGKGVNRKNRPFPVFEKMSEIKLYKMSGAGNDFVVLDGRGTDVSGFRQPERIAGLCREYRTDGLMILGAGGAGMDFGMEFYNPDGSGGMMCGNGGRCIVAFADWLGIKTSSSDHYVFMAPDGLHEAQILKRPGPQTGATKGSGELQGKADDVEGAKKDFGGEWTIRLRMIDVEGVLETSGGYFLNTGTRHFVKFVENVDTVDVEGEGRQLRWKEEFAPEGTNVNFVQVCADRLKVRTFEKGVERETLACGTGITASALAAFYSGNLPEGKISGLAGKDVIRATVRIQARRGDLLTVDFVAPEDPAVSTARFTGIHLTGPAEFSAKNN